MLKLLIILVVLSIFSPVSVLASPDGKIPDWVKNVFVWYGQDQISEDEVINAIKFLVENGIIQLDTEKTLEIWQPKPGTTWNWQLETPVSEFIQVGMYDIDLFDNDKSIVDALHDKGIKVVCYISVGSWEEWRPDASDFPLHVLGNDYENWSGEKWLDIREINSIGPILEKRLDLCKEKGFDGIEPDNIDAYTIDSGFPLTYEDQIQFNIWLAEKAHEKGLSIGLKNDFEQVNDLLPYFDWALSEDCFVYQECEKFSAFISVNKAVFQAEYTDLISNTVQFCSQSMELGFSPILKDRELTSEVETC